MTTLYEDLKALIRKGIGCLLFLAAGWALLIIVVLASLRGPQSVSGPQSVVVERVPAFVVTTRDGNEIEFRGVGLSDGQILVETSSGIVTIPGDLTGVRRLDCWAVYLGEASWTRSGRLGLKVEFESGRVIEGISRLSGGIQGDSDVGRMSIPFQNVRSIQRVGLGETRDRPTSVTRRQDAQTFGKGVAKEPNVIHIRFEGKENAGESLTRVVPRADRALWERVQGCKVAPDPAKARCYEQFGEPGFKWVWTDERYSEIYDPNRTP